MCMAVIYCAKFNFPLDAKAGDCLSGWWMKAVIYSH
ncbi:hypothetical protein Patl1_12625 [Pistacia atlantica]|uniref:Uncharacterized protein n=1 Tax=Pistacia atlantica TaxID=434234 RepID=A0ACC1ATV4_9ROSI|nr:hypothetical protein Patl1_12625 [Pistacia atlantica]